MKTCSNCGLEKDLSNFNKKRNGQQPYCKSCQHARHKIWYEKNKKAVIARSYRNSEVVRKFVISEVRAYVELNGCCACTENTYEACEFHHIDRSKKIKAVSYMIAAKLHKSKIEAEINKCAILCANCHKKFHAGLINPKMKRCNFTFAG